LKFVSLQITPLHATLTEDNVLFSFGDHTNIVYSAGTNSVGKTTLLRFLIYSLGYPVPSTRGISFRNYETTLSLTSSDGQLVILARRQDYIEYTSNYCSQRFSLPAQQNELHELLFGIPDAGVIDNLLGTFYFDQEKGWTLLNRGTVVGKIRFTIEPFLRGLSNRSNDALSGRLSTINRELEKYKQMLDVAEYNAELNRFSSGSFIATPLDEIENTLDVLRSERRPLREELQRINDVVRKNSSFESYVASFQLRVRGSNGEAIPVNKETLIGYSDIVDMLEAKRRLISEQLSALDNRITRLEHEARDKDALLELQSRADIFENQLSKIRVDAIATRRIIAALTKERKEVEETLRDCLKKDNQIVSDLHNSIAGYADCLGLDEKHFRPNEDYIFTNDLKTLSGANLHKLVFAFKLSYIKLVREQTGVILPIIMDSPSGREISEENVNTMMAIIANDFSSHQLVIASIYRDYGLPNTDIIELKDRLLPF